MENTREKLIIHVPTWLHREGVFRSFLLRPEDGKRCCLGIYLEDNCGVTPAALAYQSAPDDLPQAHIDSLPSWLFMDGANGPLVEKLMYVNDSRENSEKELRANIVELFTEAGIDVEFVEE